MTTGLSSKNDPVLYEINGLPGIQAQAGDNAASLSRKAKISLSSFLRYNDMSDRDPVIVNDVYYLAKKRKKALVPFHNVRDGETARSISQRYGIRLKKLMRYNRLDRVQKLATGRVMWLRERRPANKPVEIINSPTPPVYDQTPTPANRTADVASSGPSRPVNGYENVPRTASERKVYQPKLVGGGVTPNDGTSEPASPPRTEPTATNRPTQTTTSRSTEADGSQRVVIVRTPDGSQPAKTVPVATTPERVNTSGSTASNAPKTTPSGSSSATTRSSSPTLVMDDDLQPTSSKTAKPTDTYASAQPTKRATTRPEQGAYEGPREQQADGSITVPTTKAPPRPAAPAVAKTEPRSTPPATTDAEPKVASPSASAATKPATVNRSATTHTVEPGQTYYSISRMYGLTVDELLALNNLTTTNVLETGQQLTVKATGSRATTTQPSRSAATTPQPEVTYHTVAKGETMFRISKQYGVTIEQIQSWNNLADVGVKEGQKIKIIKQL